MKVTVYLTAHLNVDGDIYQSAAEENYWLTTESGDTLLQDFGHFTTATADIISPPPDCNCINVARSVEPSTLRPAFLALNLNL